MTLGKSFATAGTHRVRVEFAFSNLFNIENLAIPELGHHAPAFGRITDTQTVDQAGPRTIQFSLRSIVLIDRTPLEAYTIGAKRN